MAEVLTVIVLLAAGIGVWRWVVRRRNHDHEAPASCGNPQCGYPVRGVDSLRCPECGEDYREVGIATPELRRGVSVAGIILLWSVTMFIAGGFGIPMVSRVGMYGTAMSWSDGTQISNPRVNTGYAIEGRIYWWGFSPRPPSLTLPADAVGHFFVENDRAKVSFRITPESADVVVVETDGVEVASIELDETQIRETIETHLGLIESDALVKREIDDLIQTLVAFAETVMVDVSLVSAVNSPAAGTGASGFTANGGSSMTRDFIHPVTYAVTTFVFLIIWLIGARQILRR